MWAKVHDSLCRVVELLVAATAVLDIAWNNIISELLNKQAIRTMAVVHCLRKFPRLLRFQEFT